MPIGVTRTLSPPTDKHASTRTAEVHLAYTSSQLRLTVSNTTATATATATDASHGSHTATATPAPTPGGGYGLIGMRERAHSAGGRLRVGPGPHGGFEVVAELPLPRS
ncbi:hypothetical protein JIX56_22450 [Streptomyces sp. CA-210063]|uniref:ATP-binding protein n=1 Tax=Streptomyces sp. CA-210063 TaxID=2801029 RepID=UPI00214D1049|nr:ATP-binding protein [Streptomyces sp. CA-210063]UUU32440.1 hypothetical protein JIX56_22450 [Streptomyces sp. CA-210063]